MIRKLLAEIERSFDIIDYWHNLWAIIYCNAIDDIYLYINIKLYIYKLTIVRIR